MAISDAEIQSYIATGEPFGKAGGYAVQGQAAAFVESIEGSYSGIMGLPLHETYQLLRQLQIPVWRN
jgi:septum formation protein